MQSSAFQKYLGDRGLASNTLNTRTSALRAVERAEGTDLDEEFDRDGLEGLLERYRYTADDAKRGLPNPAAMEIEPEKLYKYLSFYRSALRSYQLFRQGAPAPDLVEPVSEPEAIAEADASRTFALEKDLQAALRTNLGQLEAGLTIADGGSEVKVEAGFIDILARDTAGSWVVIELKADVTRPAAVAQILAYMGCIATERGGSVRGILVGSDFDQRVVLAARAVPNLALRKYRFRFEFL